MTDPRTQAGRSLLDELNRLRGPDKRKSVVYEQMVEAVEDEAFLEGRRDALAHVVSGQGSVTITAAPDSACPDCGAENPTPRHTCDWCPTCGRKVTFRGIHPFRHKSDGRWCQ